MSNKQENQLVVSEEIQRLCVLVEVSESLEDILAYAKHDHWVIRLATAINPNCPKDLLHSLAKDNNQFVRHSIACKHNCPKDILQLLAEDQTDYIRRIAKYRLEPANDKADLSRKKKKENKN